MDSFSVRGRILLGRELVAGTLVVRDGRVAAILRGPAGVEADFRAPRPALDAAIVAPGFTIYR